MENIEGIKEAYNKMLDMNIIDISNKKISNKEIYLAPFAMYNSSTKIDSTTLVKEGYHLIIDGKQVSTRNFGVNIFTKNFNDCGFCKLTVQPIKPNKDGTYSSLKQDCIINLEGEVVFESDSCIRDLKLVNNIVIYEDKIFNLKTKEYLFNIQSSYQESKNYIVCKKSLFNENKADKETYLKYRDSLMCLNTVTCELTILD